MKGVAHQPQFNPGKWQTKEFCHEGEPMYYDSAGLTAVQVLSRPAPPGPRPLHGGKSSVVPSLVVRTPFSRVFLGHPTHQGRLSHSRRKPLRGRHQLIPSIQGFPATPRRLTVLAGIADLQLLRGPKGGRCPPRTVSSQQAKRLAAQSAGVPGLHVPSFLAVPYRALPLMLVRHLVHAYGVHEPVSTPRLPAPPVPPSSTSTSPQQGHSRSQVPKPKR